MYRMKSLFCYGDEENRHRACTNGYLTTANQSEIRKAYLASVCLNNENPRRYINVQQS